MEVYIKARFTTSHDFIFTFVFYTRQAAAVVDVLKNWYRGNSQVECAVSNVGRNKVGIMLALHEVQTARIGIQGGALFTLTFSFIGTV